MEEVTHGAAALEIIPINEDPGANQVYQLQLRRLGSEAPPSALDVYSVTAAGYPVLRWSSRSGWESHPDQPKSQYRTVKELEKSFEWMLSHPESRLVALVTFFQEQGDSSAAV